MSPEVRAYRGYYVNMDNIVPVLIQLLADAEARRSKIVLIGGGENAKLDGAVMSILALKEALYNLEVFGDLIPQADPIKEVSNAAAHQAVQSLKDAPKIVGVDKQLTAEEIGPIVQ
jgi:hypothetical protein